MERLIKPNLNEHKKLLTTEYGEKRTMKNTKSMKPEGVWDVKRRITIPGLVHAADGMAIERAVNAITGFHNISVDVDKHQVAILYDASKTDYRKILELLENTGFPRSDNWWGRVRSNWYAYCDANARDNAKAPPPACCNKPPK